MKIDFEKINYTLPEDYLKFLQNNPDGTEMCFDEYDDPDEDYDGRDWDLMGIEELKKSWKMNGVGEAENYNCLSLYVKCFQEFSGVNVIESNVGSLPVKRVVNGFVIGSENGDYLYLDPEDGFSVWIYYHDGSDVLKVSKSFTQWLEKTT